MYGTGLMLEKTMAVVFADARRLYRMMARLFVTGALCGFAIGGCGKVQSYIKPSVAVPDTEPVDDALTLLLTTLASGDFEGLASHTAEPLADDLSRAEFEDLAAIVQWLGPLKFSSAREPDARDEGGRRSYALQFERASGVDLEISIDPMARIVGFAFSGSGYTEAERGVLAEPWREFKVYDFQLLDADGKPLPKNAPVLGTHINYVVAVGGIEALLGRHHLRVEKMVRDAAGSYVFREPIEFDTTFDEDALGIPRGTVRGFVEVPGAGKWTMELSLSDENAQRTVNHEHSFETVAD